MFLALLGFASAVSRPKIRTIPKSLLSVSDSSELCIFCKFYISLMEDMLADGATEQEIIDALEGICDYLDPSVKPTCDFIIANLVPYIIEQLEAALPPQEVCILLTLCKD
jgi:saposin